jgi:hypothetical protein
MPDRSAWDTYSCSAGSSCTILSKHQTAALADFLIHFGTFTDIVVLVLNRTADECTILLTELPHSLLAAAQFKTVAYIETELNARIVCTRVVPLARLLQLTDSEAVIFVFDFQGLTIFEASTKQLLWSSSNLPVPLVLVRFYENLQYDQLRCSIATNVFTSLIWPHTVSGYITECSLTRSPHKLSLYTSNQGSGFVRTSSLIQRQNVNGAFGCAVGTRQLCLVGIAISKSTKVYLSTTDNCALDIWADVGEYRLYARLAEVKHALN